MIQFKTLKQYIQNVDGIRWVPPDLKHPFLLTFFSENSTFLESYPKLNMRRIDARYVAIPRTKIPVSYLDQHFLNEYKKLKLMAFPVGRKPPSNQNFIYDTTNYTTLIDRKFRPKNYRTRSGVLVKYGIENSFLTYPNYEKVLIYSIDLTKDFDPNWINRKFYPFLIDLKEGNIDYDHLVLNTINESGSRYRLLVKDKKYDYNRIFLFIKRLKTTEEGEEIVDSEDEELNQATEKVSSAIIPVVSPENHEKVKTLVKTYLQSRPKEIEKIQTEEEPESLVKTALTSVLYKGTNNIRKAERITQNVPKEKAAVALKRLDKEYVDQLLVQDKTKSLSEDYFIRLLEIQKVVGNKNPSHLFKKRAIDFDKNLKVDIVNSFKTLQTKELPLTIKSVQIIDKEEKTGEINKSDISLVKVKLIDKFGNEHEVTIQIPKINPTTGTFKINGQTKCLTNQIVLCPISFPKRGSAKFTSSYSTFHIETKETRKVKYLKIFIGNQWLPFLILLGLSYGLKGALDLFEIGYTISDVRPTSKSKLFCKITEDSYLYFENVDTPLKEQVVNSVYGMDFSKYGITKEFGTNEYFNDLIIKLTGLTSSTYLILTNLENMIDPVARQILINKNLPTSLDLIMKYMATKIIEGYVEDRNDLTNQRIRGSEVIVHLMQKQINSAYTQYKQQVLAGNKKAVFSINETKTFSKFVNSEIVTTMEFANPIEEMASLTKISPIGKGIGGIPGKESVETKMRNVHPSYFGNIDPNDTPESDNTGIIQQLSINSLMTSARGVFQVKEINDKEGAGILSTSSVLVPFISNNDGNRVMMACAQMKQALPLKNPDPPIVMSGYESVLTDYLSSNFVKKAPYKCKIVSITPDYIEIISQAGKKEKISIIAVHLKSGFGRDTLSVFEPVVRVGQIVQQGQILAEGSCVKEGCISTGRTFLVGYMPYKGYNFEDGIVISETVAEQQKLTSLHALEEEILISEKDRVLFITSIGQRTEKGQPLLRKTIGELEELLGYQEDESIAVLGQEMIKRSPGGVIVDIEVYCNTDLTKYKLLKDLCDRTRKTVGVAPKDKFTVGGRRIKGVLVKFKIQQELNVDLGDKLTGRHGNKGIISLIEKSENMPRTPWGEPLEIILNPVGIIGRMNIGQLYELYCGLIAKDMAIRVKTAKSRQQVINIFNSVIPELDIDEKKEYSKTFLANIRALSDRQFKLFVDSIITKGFCPILAPPFKSPSIDNIIKVLKTLNLDSGYHLYLPEYNTKTVYKVPVGYLYMNKLEHIGYLKLHARSTGKLTRSLQPTAGKRLEGGQRFGEADTYATISYDCRYLLSEMMGPLSDDRGSQNEMISDIIQSGQTSFKETKRSLARDQLTAYFISLLLDRRKA